MAPPPVPCHICRSSLFDYEAPYELRALEVGLATATNLQDREVYELERAAFPAIGAGNGGGAGGEEGDTYPAQPRRACRERRRGGGDRLRCRRA